MNRDEILKSPSMPPSAPSYPHGPYRFIDREYMILIYETDPEALRWAVPEPLVPIEENHCYFEWIRMPDSSGFGDYTESGIVIPCMFEDLRVNFTCQMYLDDDPPILAGREIWGFPKKWAQPSLAVNKDTLTGRLSYADERVAMGTMTYKHDSMLREPRKAEKALSTTQVNLKLIPGVDGNPEICQLVAYNLTEIRIKGAWSGHGRLHLVPHVNAPVADFPVRRVVAARHLIADLTLPYGRVLHDYLK